MSNPYAKCDQCGESSNSPSQYAAHICVPTGDRLTIQLLREERDRLRAELDTEKLAHRQHCKWGNEYYAELISLRASLDMANAVIANDQRIAAARIRLHGEEVARLQNELDETIDAAREFRLAEQKDREALEATNAELLAAIRLTVSENLHLADGDNCTLRHLTAAIARAQPDTSTGQENTASEPDLSASDPYTEFAESTPPAPRKLGDWANKPPTDYPSGRE